MLKRREADWGDNVRIIGLSIDKNCEMVDNHVKTNGWKKVEHYLMAGSSAGEEYGLEGVPHIVLVDTKGNIAFVGHPAKRNLEKDIDTLLKGEPIDETVAKRAVEESTAF